MHELGVVFHIIDQVDQVAAENNVHIISKVVLELGEVSTVIPEYLEDCWAWACKKNPLLFNTQLEIQKLPAVTYCEDCGQEYGTVEHGKICPHCGSEKTYLLRGNEFTIKEIEVLG